MEGLNGESMKKILTLALFSFLLFGCIDIGGDTNPPDDNNSQQPPDDGDDEPVNIVVGPQQNNTIEANNSQDDQQPAVSPKINYTETPNDLFAIYFLNVGDRSYGLQGDAVFIKKGDFDMLIDTGPSQTSGRVIDFLKSKGIDDIEVLMLTNGDPQHYGGIPLVAQEYIIEEFWWSGGSYLNDPDYQDAVQKASEKAYITQGVEEGYTRTLNGMTFEILNPPSDERFGDTNNDAIVTRFSDRDFTMLLMSGVQTGAQGKLINDYNEKIKCQVIQAPYYGLGAGTANIGVFLIHSNPETMIISGSYDEATDGGSSRQPFFRYMKQYDVTWYKTYDQGTVRITGDGKDYGVAYLG